MRRIRTQLTLLTLLVALLGIAGTTYYLTRAYITDKRNYVVELSSSTAPKIADSISKKLGDLISKTALYESAAGKSRVPPYLLNLFDGASGLSEVRTYSRGKLVHRVELDTKASLNEDIILPDPSLITGTLFFRVPGSSDLIFLSPSRSTIPGSFYLFRVHSDFFKTSYELAPAFHPVLVDQDGNAFLTDSNPQIDTSSLKELLSSLGQGSMVARELENRDQGKSLFILSGIKGVSNAVLLVQAPITNATDLIRPVFRTSLPFLAVIFILSVFFAVLFAAKVARPIEELTTAASNISKGEWTAPDQGRSSYEITRLVRAFSKMVKDLEAREKEIERANRELVRSERLAVLGKFGAGIAHEVKNPLTSILGYAQLIRRKLPGALEEKEIQFVDFIMAETKRASKIISDLLMFSRQKNPELREQMLLPLVERTIEMLRPQAEEKSVELKLQNETLPGKDWVAIDSDQFFQVLTNIVSNAIQALEECGRPVKWVSLKLYHSDTKTILEVQDNGPGISNENLGSIFEPFFSTKAVGKGSGLGLALSLGIVEQHAGKLDVFSEVGVGTTFRISLPSKSPRI